MNTNTIPVFPRDLLQTALQNPRLVSAFETLINLLTDTVTAVQGSTGPVAGLSTAPFVLQAANENYAGGFVLEGGATVNATVAGNSILLSVTAAVPTVTGDGGVNFIITGATNLILPTVGTVATTSNIFNYIAGAQDFADDAAAAAGGVPVGGIYRTASVLKVRVV